MTLISKNRALRADFFLVTSGEYWNLLKRYSSLSTNSREDKYVRYVVKKASWYINSVKHELLNNMEFYIIKTLMCICYYIC